MRVAYVCTDPGVPVFGSKGCSVHVQAYLRAFIARQAEVTLIARQTGGDVPQAFSSMRVLRLPRPLVTEVAEREQALLAGDAEVSLALEAAGPFDIVYERHALWSQAAMTFARRMGVPGILEVNAPLVDEQERHRLLIDRESAKRTARAAFEAASSIVAVSDQVAERLGDDPTIAAKTIIVPNGVDVDQFTPRSGPREADQPFTVGFVGTLKPWHGLDDLLQAFKSVSDHDPAVRLLIVGDGPERAQTERALEAFGLRDQVTFTGKIRHDEVPEWILRMDVAVAPYPSSIACYFSPLKLYEYMACGVPVVASDTGQISDTITDNVNGLLYAPGDVQALVGAILELKGRPTLGLQLGRAARADAATKHTWSAALDRILASLDLSFQNAAGVM